MASLSTVSFAFAMQELTATPVRLLLLMIADYRRVVEQSWKHPVPTCGGQRDTKNPNIE
jgi:hypothetical protein